MSETTKGLRVPGHLYCDPARVVLLKGGSDD